MAPKWCVRLHAEYKPMLSMLNIVLDLSQCIKNGHRDDNDAEVCYVDVEANCIIYRSASAHVVFYLQHLQLFPATCRGLRWCSPSELHLSIHAESSQGKGLSIKCENGIISHVEEESSENNQDIVVNKIKQCQNSCYCAGCGRPIFTSKSSFKRVLPLPSENWSDFADIWFCHNHSHQAQDAASCTSSQLPEHSQNDKTQGLKMKTLCPRPSDCLVSNLYLLVDSGQVCHTTVGITPHTQRLVCLRCGNFLGFIKKKGTSRPAETESSETGSVYKIYLHAVKFLSAETFTSSNINNTGPPFAKMPKGQNDSMSDGLVENFLCKLFCDQSRLFTSFRFMVQSSHEEHGDNIPIVLLVWLLDQNLQVFSSDFHIPAASSEVSENQVPTTHVLKLLYKASFLNSAKTGFGSQASIFKMWERDNTVHGLDLPYPLCKQLLSLLILSTKQLPSSQRCLNSFHVGYLHKRHESQDNVSEEATQT